MRRARRPVRVGSVGVLVVALLAVLASLLGGCCYLPWPSTAAPMRAQPAQPAPTQPAPAQPVELGALPPPREGEPQPVFGRQLTLALPPASVVHRSERPGQSGWLSVEAFELDDHVSLWLADLPCVPEEDLARGAVAEIARRAHVAPSSLAVRALPLLDPTLRAIEAVPTTRVQESNDEVILWAIVAIGPHVILATGRRWSLADGLGPSRVDPARRLLLEAILRSARTGDWTFGTGLHGSLPGDLVRDAEAPEGWVARESGCCNEDPPYTTRFDAHVLRTRALGEPTRARVSVRNIARCDPGSPGPSGVVHGVPMQWTQTADHLCWVESTTDNERGLTWHVRGASPEDLADALAIAARISR